MSSMDKAENVKEQYKDDNNLSIRIKLHAKHSTNKQGSGNLWFPLLVTEALSGSNPAGDYL